MNTPNLYSPEVVASIIEDMGALIGEKWVPLRPMGLQGIFLRKRFSLAWNVLMGRYDAVKWSGQ